MSDTSPEETHWRKVIWFVPIAYLIGIATGSLYILNRFADVDVPLAGTDAIFVLGVVAVLLIFLATVSLPYALHRDILSLDTGRSDAEWVPDRSTFVRRALYGLTIPGLTLVVSSYYLYQLRKKCSHI
ncbi:hypothetical protein [Halorubellus litoreus]|uniref:Uncharacterized protein n=1 Tax=Halorubellus litoreus TaxID=755308 RepID=A0ABD5VJN4_9EURY